MGDRILPPLPRHMAHLPTDHRGFPVPWFVAWIDGEPDFRVIGPGKIAQAWNKKLCWLCGEKLGRFQSFVIGPMCAVNRTSAEPPSHLDCARYAALACPFLTKPAMRRNEKDMPEDAAVSAGTMIRRNPGCCAVWTTREPRIFRAGQGHLFNIGEPNSVEWFAEGREATRGEVLLSIDTGMPLLIAECDRDPDPAGARAELIYQAAKAGDLLPKSEAA